MTTAPTDRKTPRERLPVKSTERIPPHDLDAEKALLGSMMMSREAVGEVIPIIGRSESEWFYVPAHRKIFELLVDLYDDPTKAIDLVVAADELRRRELLDYVGGNEYLVELAESFADWTNAEHYAQIVRDKGLLRDLIYCTGTIEHDAFSGLDSARDILDRAEQRIFEATEKRTGGRIISIGAAVARLRDQLENQDGRVTGLPTGFVQLDEYTTGFQPGDLVVVAGRPSMGKTALGLTIAHHLSMVEHKSVVFFSMEMSADQVAQRLACAHTGISSQRIRLGKVNEQDKLRLVNACEEFKDVPLYIDDTPGMTAMEVRASARRLKQKFDIQAVFVDYLQLMHTPGAESRQAEIAAISRGLKGLGRELGIPIIAMAQLNRMAEGRPDKRPLMSDLRESGAIEQDADVVLLIHREEYYKPEDDSVKGIAELILAKQRNGPTGSIKLHFDRKLTRFTNLEMQPEPYGTSSGASPF